MEILQTTPDQAPAPAVTPQHDATKGTSQAISATAAEVAAGALPGDLAAENLEAFKNGPQTFTWEIGSQARCVYKDNKKYMVTIEEREMRVLEPIPNGILRAIAAPADTEPTGNQVKVPFYYVHFNNWARKFDMWVPYNKVYEVSEGGSKRRRIAMAIKARREASQLAKDKQKNCARAATAKKFEAVDLVQELATEVCAVSKCVGLETSRKYLYTSTSLSQTGRLCVSFRSPRAAGASGCCTPGAVRTMWQGWCQPDQLS